VLLCDDHLLLLESVMAVFEGRGHTVDTALSPRQAVELLAERGADVCVLDLGFPKEDVDDPVALVRQAFPATPIVVFTATDQVSLERARAAGAHGWVSKEDSITALVQLVERVAQEPHAAHSTWDIQTAPSPAAKRSPHFLTPRELQALEGLVSGKNTTELAQWMGVRESTVSTHIQTVLTKLGVHSRLEAVAYAMATRLVTEVPSRLQAAASR
jgi:DNA-binding NarL/FixJ family response regulator